MKKTKKQRVADARKKIVHAARFRIPAELNGWKVHSVAASRKSGTGVPLFQIRNVTDGVDVLSTRISIDSGETDSSTAPARRR